MKTILIMDDELFMRRLLEQTLRRSGARPVCVDSGDAALAWLARETADLLLIDFNMPGRGGLADVRARAAELGVAAFFTKPFSPSALAVEVARLLGG